MVRLFKDLASFSGKGVQQAIDSEAAAMCESALASTAPRNYAKSSSAIKQRYNARKFQTKGGKKYFIGKPTVKGYIIKSGPRKGQTVRRINNKGNRQPDSVWDRILDFPRQIKIKIDSLGIAKRNWYELAKKIGFTIKAPNWVTTANFMGRVYSEGNAAIRRGKRKGAYSLELTNSGKNHKYTKADRAWKTAVNKRIKYFLINVEKGVFKDIQQIAKKYPKLKLTK